jgi:hypothetical protein
MENRTSETIEAALSSSSKRKYKAPALLVFGRLTTLTQSYSCTDSGDNNAFPGVCTGGTMSMPPP